MGDQAARAILLVEDDAFLQGLYEAQLTAEGYEVRVAGTGERALDQMAEDSPDLVLLDLVMPGMSGYDVLARMRENPALSRIPVIVFSNKGEPGDVERAMAAGATDYLVKTVTPPREVMDKIDQILTKASRESTPMLVAIHGDVLDAARMAECAGRSRSLDCGQCGAKLVLELRPKDDQPGSFEARLICPKCQS
jgi:CheY-like chemotaxis protein